MIPLVFDQFIGIGSGSIRFIIDRVDRINIECITIRKEIRVD